LCAVFFCTFLQSYKRTCGVRVLVCLGTISPNWYARQEKGAAFCSL